VVRQHLLDDLGNVGEELVEVQSLAGGGGDLQQEIEQLGSLAKTDSGFAGSLHGVPLTWRPVQAAVASTILTLALAPIRVAPAAVIVWRSASERMPPEALTPIDGPTALRISATSCAVAPEGPNPVEVFTKSAPACLESVEATVFWLS